jgi:hypothetical protein
MAVSTASEETGLLLPTRNSLGMWLANFGYKETELNKNQWNFKARNLT